MAPDRTLQRAAQKAEDRRQIHIDDDLFFVNLDPAVNLLPGCSDQQVHIVFIGPAGLDRRHARWKVTADFVAMRMHAAAHFLAAKLVGQSYAHRLATYSLLPEEP